MVIDPSFGVVIGDEDMRDLYELSSRERRALDETGALLLPPWYPDGDGSPDRVEVTVATADGSVVVPAARRDRDRDAELAARSGESVGGSFRGIYGSDVLMMTERAARDAGFDVVVWGGYVRSDADLTSDQQRRIRDVVGADGSGQTLTGAYVGVADANIDDTQNLYYESRNPTSPLKIQAVVVGIALAFALIVVAIGLGLAAAGGKDERDVLVAVGARPGTLRSMAGAKAAMITLTGVLVGVSTALVPWALGSWAVGKPLTMPWLTVGGLVVLVPVVAALSTWLVSAVVQRLRPVRLSTFAFE